MLLLSLYLLAFLVALLWIKYSLKGYVLNFLQRKHSCYFTSVWKIKIKSSYIEPEKENLQSFSYYFAFFDFLPNFGFATSETKHGH